MNNDLSTDILYPLSVSKIYHPRSHQKHGRINPILSNRHFTEQSKTGILYTSNPTFSAYHQERNTYCNGQRKYRATILITVKKIDQFYGGFQENNHRFAQILVKIRQKVRILMYLKLFYKNDTKYSQNANSVNFIPISLNSPWKNHIFHEIAFTNNSNFLEDC